MTRLKASARQRRVVSGPNYYALHPTYSIILHSESLVLSAALRGRAIHITNKRGLLRSRNGITAPQKCPPPILEICFDLPFRPAAPHSPCVRASAYRETSSVFFQLSREFKDEPRTITRVLSQGNGTNKVSWIYFILPLCTNFFGLCLLADWTAKFRTT